ncbi:hypothetical protein P7D43_22125, partial [Enterococcus avium]
IRFHKSIIKEKTVDIIHKMDFVYSLIQEKNLLYFFVFFPIIDLFKLSLVNWNNPKYNYTLLF